MRITNVRTGPEYDPRIQKFIDEMYNWLNVMIDKVGVEKLLNSMDKVEAAVNILRIKYGLSQVLFIPNRHRKYISFSCSDKDVRVGGYWKYELK